MAGVWDSFSHRLESAGEGRTICAAMVSVLESGVLGGSELVAGVCESRGWSRPELAAELGVSRHSVGLWERSGRLTGQRHEQLLRLLSAAPPPIELRPLRKQLGWTQDRMARRLGVDRSRVARWERGERMPARAQERARKLQRTLEPPKPRKAKSALRLAREDVGMTMLELADWLGVSVASVSRWERGIRPIPPEFALAMRALAPSDHRDRPTPEWVRARREERELSYRELGAKLDVHPAHVREWESGERPIPARLYGDLRRALEPQARFRQRDNEVFRLVSSMPEGLTMRELLEQFPQHDHRAVLGSLKRHVDHGDLFKARKAISSKQGRRLFGWRFYPQFEPDDPIGSRMTGNWLRAKLTETGWTQTALADALGITRGGIKDWLRNGDCLIPPARHREVVQLLAHSEPPAPPPPKPRPPSALPLMRERRLAAGLTQRELAERTGIPVVTLGNYERGKRPVPPERADLIEAALAEGPTLRAGSEGGSRRGVATLTNTPRGAGRVPQTYESMRKRTVLRSELDTRSGRQPVSSDELRAARGAHGQTRREFAEQLGVTHTRIRNWEEGISPVPTALWEPIRDLAASGVPADTPPMTAHELRVGRERLGLTQRELAERIGATVPRLRHWEQGNAAMPRSMWECVRSVLEGASTNRQAHLFE